MNALFVCSRNRLRGPTAEQIFATWPDVDTDSAGLAPDAEVQLSSQQIEWADIIFVMERSHQAKLKGRFRRHINGKRIVCLDIRDKYPFMAPELVALLEQKVGGYLR